MPHFEARVADGQCAGDVGGAILILRAAVDQQEAVGIQGAVAFLGNPVMDHGPVRAGTADCIKADVMQQIGGGAATLKLRYNVNLTQPGGIRGVKPGKKPHHGGAITQMRCPAAIQFGARLAGFRQATGIQTAQNLSVTRRQRIESGLGQGGRLDQNRVREICETSRKGVPRGKCYSLWQDHICKFHFIAKECHLTIGGQESKAMDNRRPRHIAATQIEQPTQAVWQGDHSCLRRLRCNGGTEAAGFVFSGVATKMWRMRPSRGVWWGRPICPNGVHPIGTGHQ